MLSTWRQRRTERRRLRREQRVTPFQHGLHDLWLTIRILVTIVIAWNALSFANYTLRDNGDEMSSRAATWVRNHHMGFVVDWLETQLYSEPPSNKPAEELALIIGPVPAPTVPAASVPAPAVPAASSSTPTTMAFNPTATTAPDSPLETAPTVTAPPPPGPPEPLNPLVTPALDGEGQWTPIATSGGRATIWATSIRPLPDASSVVASVAEIDQSGLRAAMFNGSEQPGGTWGRSNRVGKSLQPALLAGFNGGFRFDHIKGGYMTEGVTVRAMHDGDATIGITREGKVVIGEYGRDLTDDGSWVTLRQNLILIVDNGTSQVQRGIAEGVWWGADFGREVYVPRSAACIRSDGRLAYAMVSKVDASQFADALINVGCVTAIQLDINGTWPVFFTFSHNADGTAVGHFLDSRMGGNPQRYVSGTTKEFFAFFDPALVPQPSALDL